MSSRSSNQKKEELVLEEHAKSVAYAPLPLLACGQGHEHAGTILLLSIPRLSTAKQHKQVLKM
jgi:hypothetical protein